METYASAETPTDIEVSPDGSRVFVAGNKVFAAFDAQTGNLVWDAPFPLENDGSISDLAVSRDGATVYATGIDTSFVPNEGFVNSHLTAAFDAAGGAPRWKVKSGGDFVEVSPGGDRLYVVRSACPNDFYSFADGCADYYEAKALNAATGATLWTGTHDTGMNGGDYPFSTALSPDGSRLFVTGQGATVGFSADNGAKLWSTFAETETTFWSIDISSDGSLVITTGQTCQPDGSSPCNLYATMAQNASTGAVEWIARLDGQTGPGGPLGTVAWFGTWPEDGSLAVGHGPYGDRVYVTGYAGYNTNTDVSRADLDYDGLTLAYDLRTGAEVWRARFSGTESGTEENGWFVEATRDGSAVYVTGRAYSTGPSGAQGPRDFATLSYDAASGSQNWIARYNSAANGSDTDVPSGGMALARDGGRLFVAGTFSPTHFFVPTSTTEQSWGLVAYDGVPEPPSVSVGDATVHEGDGGKRTASFTVSLSKPAVATVTVSYATASVTASAPGDFDARTGALNFEPGVTSQVVQVPVPGDKTQEGDETFALGLTSPSGGAIIADGAGVGTILDDDPATSSVRRLAVGDVVVHEGDAGGRTAVFNVSLSKASTSNVTVSFATAKGTAVGRDFTARSGALSFAPGSTSLNVKVAIAPDTITEGAESFSVKFSGASGAAIVDSVGVGTIVDND